MKRERLQSILRWLLDHLVQVTYEGLENLPPTGGLLVAANHMSRVDVLLLLANPARPDFTALVAHKYQKVPLFNWVLRAAQVIWLDPDKADFAAFRQSLEALNNGAALGMAPEGTRSQIGQLLEGKPGTALLAQRANVPIVPVGIAGSETFFRDLLRLRRPRVTVRFGPAFRIEPAKRDNRGEWLNHARDEIMLRIAAQLPQKYWGYYKNHPRLKTAEGRLGFKA